MRLRLVTSACLTAILVAVGLGVGTGARPSGPSMLLVTVDTLRADHVSAYGYPHPTTPILDALGREGTVFEAAYTPTPTTGPSHATLLTARYPAAHGVLKNGLALRPDVRTLAEALRDAGWHTGAVVSAFPLAARFGWDRGFDHYDDDFPLETASIGSEEWEGFDVREGFDRRADATTDRAVAWLARTPDRQPWLLWVHYYDPHAPYDPPPGYRRLARAAGTRDPAGDLEPAIAAYDGEIRFADEQIGRLVRAAEARAGARSLLVVVASDHGEGLMSHGWMDHGVNLYEELVRTVLVLRWPGRIRAAQRVRQPVGLVDVAPTVLALLGRPTAPFAPHGEDLSPVLRHGTPPPGDRPLFFQRRLYTERDERAWPVAGEMFAVRRGGWKYIVAPAQGTAELFDLVGDPRETRNVRAAAADVEQDLAAATARWAAGQRGAPPPAVAAGDAARLRALGYVQ
jgi:arylsulfatase A-like enzyme